MGACFSSSKEQWNPYLYITKTVMSGVSLLQTCKEKGGNYNGKDY